ncbi:hypothetical protein LAZ67_X001874 [Cordylochernes scorpioides]|uniref:Reverse transcriptase n=1 Tax=Cordylochernes scorpioides TaxID=51811 RepID=A0ABY6LW16_9ARAC|nr:hypothetical protein LAZ67_X001874 [Cordylochernes scorpioides]
MHLSLAAMASRSARPLSTIAAEIVMTRLDTWINKKHLSVILIWRRYVDDIFCTCKNSQENSFKAIPFLDILILRTPNAFHTTVYYKKNSHPCYIQFSYFCPIAHKINLVKALTKRIHTYCSHPQSRISHLGRFPTSFN